MCFRNNQSRKFMDSIFAKGPVWCCDRINSYNLKIQLGIFMDINVRHRCRGRLENAGLSESAKQPILLSKHNKYTALIIDMYHRKALHTGIAQTISLIGQK